MAKKQDNQSKAEAIVANVMKKMDADRRREAGKCVNQKLYRRVKK